LKTVQIKIRCNQYYDGVFGARLLGAALVVNSDYAALTGENPLRSFATEICRIQDDYQSGPERPHSKGRRRFESSS
jgi:hypothetical protein